MKNARVIWILILVVLGPLVACSRTEETPESLMKSGVDSLYVKSDPDAAAKAFRKVLAKNPEHYGANFQLAVALDRSGKPAEARPLWEKSLAMAEAIKEETPPAYLLSGRGTGHGAGMCQAGAIARAKRGESRDAILDLYYRGAGVQSL